MISDKIKLTQGIYLSKIENFKKALEIISGGKKFKVFRVNEEEIGAECGRLILMLNDVSTTYTNGEGEHTYESTLVSLYILKSEEDFDKIDIEAPVPYGSSYLMLMSMEYNQDMNSTLKKLGIND